MTLDLTKPLHMRGQTAKLISTTKDGKFIFQGDKTKRVVLVDINGQDAEGAQVVYNKDPDQPRRRKISRFAVGDTVYRIAMHHNERVKVGTIVEINGHRALVKVDGKFCRNHPEGWYAWFLPYLQKTPEEVLEFAESINAAMKKLVKAPGENSPEKMAEELQRRHTTRVVTNGATRPQYVGMK